MSASCTVGISVHDSVKLNKILQSTFTGSGLQHTSKAKIEKIIVPYIPYEKQKYIVSKIEVLFSELDKGLKTLQTTKRQLAVYRQAVFKEAFDVGAIVKLSEIVDDIKIGPFGTMLHKTDYIAGGIPVINPQHIKNLCIEAGNKTTISKEKSDELAEYQLKTNDIIMGRRGEMGRAAAVTKKENGWICGTGSILIRLKSNYDAVFYSQVLSSPNIVHYLEENATGTTMKNLNEDIVSHIPVPKISHKMQLKIKSYIGKKMSTCDSIEKAVDIALFQAESMRQSILKQAFKGEL